MLEATFFMPRPLHAKKGTKLLDSPHFYRPDLDNLFKFLTDSMDDTEVIFTDDCQISCISTKKIYGNPPRTEIILTELL